MINKQIPYDIHPAAMVFPFMEDEELQKLSDDIREYGLREPIWLHENNGKIQLLDGRNRYIACVMAGVKPDVTWYKGDEHHLVDFIVSLNVRRRHLTAIERSNAALALIPMYEAEAKERQQAAGGGNGRGGGDKRTVRVVTTLSDQSEDDRKATARAAKAVGASPDSVKKMKRLKDNAPDLFERVCNKDCSISAAIKQLQLREKEKKERDKKKEEKLAAQKAAREQSMEEVDKQIKETGGTGIVDYVEKPPPDEYLIVMEESLKNEEMVDALIRALVAVREAKSIDLTAISESRAIELLNELATEIMSLQLNVIQPQNMEKS